MKLTNFHMYGKRQLNTIISIIKWKKRVKIWEILKKFGKSITSDDSVDWLHLFMFPGIHDVSTEKKGLGGR